MTHTSKPTNLNLLYTRAKGTVNDLLIICFVGQSNQRGAPPPYGFNVSEEARAEEIRWRRLRRFDS